MGAFELSVVFWQETLERGSNPTDVTQFEKRLRHLIREKFSASSYEEGDNTNNAHKGGGCRNRPLC